MTNNEWGFLGKEGNSILENIGYGLGTIANLYDINNIFDATIANLYTQTTDNGQFDPIFHSAIVSEDGKIMMSYGPEQNPSLQKSSTPMTKLGFALRYRTSSSYTQLIPEKVW